jgi:hypothetical protein
LAAADGLRQGFCKSLKGLTDIQSHAEPGGDEAVEVGLVTEAVGRATDLKTFVALEPAARGGDGVAAGRAIGVFAVLALAAASPQNCPTLTCSSSGPKNSQPSLPFTVIVSAFAASAAFAAQSAAKAFSTAASTSCTLGAFASPFAGAACSAAFAFFAAFGSPAVAPQPSIPTKTNPSTILIIEISCRFLPLETHKLSNSQTLRALPICCHHEVFHSIRCSMFAPFFSLLFVPLRVLRALRGSLLFSISPAPASPPARL